MTEDSRTLLEKRVLSKLISPESVRYSITRNRLVVMGGIGSNEIYAKRFNKKDYLIINKDSYKDREIPLAIVNENHSDEFVLKTLYEKATKVAEEWAKFDHNKILDLTGNKPIPEEAKYYQSRYSYI